MEQLNISLEELKTYAANFRSQNQKLDQHLKHALKLMNELSATWSSPAQMALVSRFKKLLPVFEEYAFIIENYARYLDSTYDSYEMLETKMKNGAEGV